MSKWFLHHREKVAAQLNDPKTKSKIEITDELKEEIDRFHDKWSEVRILLDIALLVDV